MAKYESDITKTFVRTLVPMPCIGMNPGGSAFEMKRQGCNPRMSRQSQSTRLNVDRVGGAFPGIWVSLNSVGRLF